ncbi:MAG: hypothetical protein UU76_C0016G0017 [Parcubacteria group bacterium GW2011_GWC1_41_7]|nr:MAG: hypothetical protein UU76_C0016G0017 [Parcubacteria group bacterium GW2011_GWC1_41_7]
MSTIKQKKEKGQIFLIVIGTTIFISVMLYALLLPFMQQAQGVVSIADSYQAIASAEGGLEAELIYQFKNVLPYNSSYMSCVSYTGNKQTHTATQCTVGNIEMDVKVSPLGGSVSVDSIGRKNDIERLLFLR